MESAGKFLYDRSREKEMEEVIERAKARLIKLIQAGDQLVEANLADEEYWKAARDASFRAGLRHALDILDGEIRG